MSSKQSKASRTPDTGTRVPTGPKTFGNQNSANQGVQGGNPGLEKIFPGYEGVGGADFDTSNEWNQQLMRIAAEQGEFTA